MDLGTSYNNIINTLFFLQYVCHTLFPSCILLKRKDKRALYWKVVEISSHVICNIINLYKLYSNNTQTAFLSWFHRFESLSPSIICIYILHKINGVFLTLVHILPVKRNNCHAWMNLNDCFSHNNIFIISGGYKHQSMRCL
jgi:hypothetical protein